MSEREAQPGISVRILQNWEIARSSPTGPALGWLRRVMEGPLLQAGTRHPAGH